MSYVLDYNDIKVGALMKNKHGIIYQIMHVDKSFAGWREGKWKLKVRYLNRIGGAVEERTEFTLEALPSEICAYIHNVTEKDLEKLMMIGAI